MEGAPGNEGELARLKTAMMDANYEGDLEDLASLSEQAGRVDDGDLVWLASYHAGWAHYTIALMTGPNGLVSPEGDADAVARHVDAAMSALEVSVEGKPDFADALALLSHVYSMAVRADPESGRVLGPKGRQLLARALTLEPDNPRVVLIEAMRLFWLPSRFGGDRDRALERWKRAIRLFEMANQPASSPLPSWGHAEAWAWLSGAYLSMEPPDATAANQAVEMAVEIQPEFRWLHVSAVPLAKEALVASP